jgi:hypothetical protein
MGGALLLPQRIENRERKQTPLLDEYADTRNAKRDGVFCGKAKTISR